MSTREQIAAHNTNVARYCAEVARLPHTPITLRCPNGHEWATTETRPTKHTYTHYAIDCCPVCNEPWSSGRLTPEQAEEIRAARPA